MHLAPPDTFNVPLKTDCAISRLAGSRAISKLLYTQFSNFQNAQRNFEIAQISKMRGTYTRLSFTLLVLTMKSSWEVLGHRWEVICPSVKRTTHTESTVMYNVLRTSIEAQLCTRREWKMFRPRRPSSVAMHFCHLFWIYERSKNVFVLYYVHVQVTVSLQVLDRLRWHAYYYIVSQVCNMHDAACASHASELYMYVACDIPVPGKELGHFRSETLMLHAHTSW